MIKSLAVVSILCFLAPTASFDGVAHFEGNFQGKGTFYGQGGAGNGGACMLERGFNSVGITAAINSAQWDEGLNCGKCILVTGHGEGIGTTPVVGPIYATIDNICGECKMGDIDLGLAGDGIWKIHWDFVDCGEARNGGSIVPVKTTPNRELGPLAGTYLAPGQYVTADGIKSVEEVQKAEKEFFAN